MREIKFRAWDQINKTMLSDGLPHLGEGKYFYLNQMISLCREQKMILEQFTGLRDRNGKEIYEGDIVRQLDLIENKAIVDAICFGEGCFTVGDGTEEFISPGQSEVIGTIHENQELLNVRS